MLDYFKDGSVVQDILSEAQTGLWIIELEDEKPPRLYADKSMMYLLGLNEEVSPEDCYQIWYGRIEDSYYPQVNEAVEQVIGRNRGEVQYLWNHPSWGKIHIRCGGVRDSQYENGFRIKGYHQNITDLIALKQEYNAVIETLSRDYNGIYLGNIKENTYKAIKIPEAFKNSAAVNQTYDEFLNDYIEHVVAPEFRELVQTLVGRELVLQRLQKGEYKNECIYRNIDGGWRLIQIMPSGEYSDDNPYVIVAFSDQDSEIEKRYSEAISQLSISRMYALAISINLDKTEYNCIHCSDDIMKLSHHGVFQDFHDKLHESIVESDRKELELIYDLDNYRERGYVEGDVRARSLQGDVHYYRYYATRIMLDMGERILITLRNVDDKQKAYERDKVLSNLCQCYYSVYLFHLDEGVEQPIWQEGFVEDQNEFPKGSLSQYYNKFVKYFVDFRDKDKMQKAGSKAFLQKTLTEEQPVYDVDYRRIYPDGISWVRSRFSIAEMKEGKPSKVIFANMNIDEQKKKELEEQEQKRQNFEYKNIIKGLSSFYHSVFYVDINEGTYQAFTQRSDINQYIKDMNDFTELISIYAENLIKKEDQEQFISELSSANISLRINSGETIYSVEYRRDYGGYYGWMRMHVILAEKVDGIPTKIILAGHNVEQEKEEEKKNRQALQAAYESATAANDAKSDFLAQMSHDIRTPMNAIVGMTTIAAANVSDPEKIMDCLKKIDISSKHLLTLINEMLDMSKIEKGKIVLAEEPFNLTEMVSELNIILRPSVLEKNHGIQFQMKSLEHESLIGDAGRLRQVLLNLLTNAVKYTPDGGHIQVTTREEPSNLPGYGCFTFVVKDNGIGMSEEFMERIFVPFERSDEAKSLNIQGTGLGLAIARSIVLIMQGDIQVKSRLGEGTEFSLTLYLKIAEEDENCRLETDRQLHVLVVDDNQIECEKTCVMLNDLGLIAEGVFSGKEALEKADQKLREGGNYFAAIVDWNMPEMDGGNTARQLKQRLGETVPVFVLTAYEWDNIEKKAVSAGVNGFIPKPAGKSKLYRIFKGLVEQNYLKNTDPQDDVNPLLGVKVLLVEDNELNQEIAAEFLSMAGAEVTVAANGLVALNIIKEDNTYQVILMDIRMPVMDGYEAAQAIRGLGRADTDAIPIIAMTANAFPEDVRAALDSGMNEHIAKPIDIDRITSVLKTYLKID